MKNLQTKMSVMTNPSTRLTKKSILPMVFVFVLRGVSNPQNSAQLFLRVANFD
jgi:hypothetical protein